MSSTNAARAGRAFVDTNILVYSVDPGSGEKAGRATTLLNDLWVRRDGCLSMQVLQEFFVSVTTKLSKPLPVSEAAARVADFVRWNLHSPGGADLLAAIDLQRDYR